MKLRVVAGGAALAGLLAWSSAADALGITMGAATPAPIGKAQTFRVAKVDGAVGALTFRWNFSDGSPTDTSSGMQATHAFKDPGHYTVSVVVSDSQTTTGASVTTTAHYPLTAGAPHNSSSIVVDAEHHQVWNVNPDSDSVSVIDADTRMRVREVAVGKEPHSLALAPDGTIWVANQMSDEVVVLEQSSGEIQKRIALPYASQPRAVAFGPSGKAYVSLFATGKLVEIDPAAPDTRRELPLGPTPAGVSVADDGRIFVTRFVSPADHGEVWVVSPETLTLTNTIQLAFDQGPDTESSGRGVPNYVSSMVISPDGTQAWVSAKKDDVARGPHRDGLPSNSDNFVRGIVCVIDLKTEAEVIVKRIDIDNRSLVVSVAFSQLGDYAYLLLEANNWIGMYEAYNEPGVAPRQLGGIKDVGNAPDGLALSPDGILFVNAFLSREVIAYDLRRSLESDAQEAPAPLARIRTIDQEPLTAEVLLGKQVFFNAMDPRMSKVGYIACVTCHFHGMSDGRVWDFTSRGEGLRNTKSLLGVRGMAEGRIHWSANFNEIQDFERDIRDSFEGQGFMPQEAFMARMDASGRYDPFGQPAAGVSKELDGLAAYLASLDQVPRSPFRNPDGSFTSDALEGRKVFEQAECGTCHSGPDFTDSAAGTLHNVGTILPTSGTRLFGPLMGTDTPSLKGVWATAPYLHDGRAATLEEIFTKYLTRDEMGKTSGLSEIQVAHLAEYLRELDDVPETVPPPPPEEHRGLFHCSVEKRSPSGTSRSLTGWLIATALMVVARWRRPKD